ncbi:hypothetical protein JCM19992_34140 [Thermostilla marina]
MRTFCLSLGVLLCLGLFTLGCQRPAEPAGGTTDAAEESTATPHDASGAASTDETAAPADVQDSTSNADETGMSFPAAATESAADDAASDDEEGEVRLERVFGVFGKAAVETAETAGGSLGIPAPPSGDGGYPADAPPAPAFNP